jgi:uncharacterized repeat protein (TIGR03803 family)
VLTTLLSFSGTNGKSPDGPLTFDSNGNLFGTTSYGGTNNDGTVYEIAAGTHAFVMLASMSSASGANPQGGLTIDSQGNIFGVAPNGGLNGDGTLFELSPSAQPIAVSLPYTQFTTLTPIPEPSTWLLLAIGGAALIGCGIARRRRGQTPLRDPVCPNLHGDPGHRKTGRPCIC